LASQLRILELTHIC